MKKFMLLTALAIMTLAASGCGWRRGCGGCSPGLGWGAPAAKCCKPSCEPSCSTCGPCSSGPAMLGGGTVIEGGFVPGGGGETYLPGNFTGGTVIGPPISDGLPAGTTLAPPTLAPAPSN